LGDTAPELFLAVNHILQKITPSDKNIRDDPGMPRAVEPQKESFRAVVLRSRTGKAAFTLSTSETSAIGTTHQDG
jgi:hypothetical protein